MNDTKKVIIGIQARSGSKRLPGKVLEFIDDATMIGHVVAAARAAARYINRSSNQTKVSCQHCVLIPKGDPIAGRLQGNAVIEGEEDDVLGRYALMFQEYKPDYIVRITGDCPLIIPQVISKHVFCAVQSGLDYLTNSMEKYRTHPDGWDCEIISAKLFQWVIETAESAHDKEHVTTLIKTSRPNWAKVGVVMGHIDLSHIKVSVDTIEDLSVVRKLKHSLEDKMIRAHEEGFNVFRLF